MIDSRGTNDQPVRLNERTRRAVLVRVGVFAALACVGEIAFAIGYGWPSSILAFWPTLWLVGWLSNTLSATEWTIGDQELRRRRWLSLPGSRPSAVMPLGPQVEIVHESWARWRIRPHGPVILVQPWRTRQLVDAMERADVRVNDWRGAWNRRHRLLNDFGLLVIWGVAPVLAFVAAAFAPLKPDSVAGAVAFWALVGVLVLGLAFDFLPWNMRRPSTQDA